jgi:hypothetical protein
MGVLNYMGVWRHGRFACFWVLGELDDPAQPHGAGPGATHAHTRARTRAHARACAHTRTHTSVHARAYTHTHARARAHAHALSRSQDFGIILDDVSITHLSFGKEYSALPRAARGAFLFRPNHSAPLPFRRYL